MWKALGGAQLVDSFGTAMILRIWVGRLCKHVFYIYVLCRMDNIS